MRRGFNLFSAAILGLALQTCSDPEPKEVRIADVYPHIGTAGTIVRIYGQDFSSNAVVKFNGVEGETMGSSPARLYVRVPETSTGKIEITSYGKTIETDFDFEYSEPSGSWNEKNEFPGVHRFGSLCFSTDEYGFVGLGIVHNQGFPHLKDFWKYIPTSDTWEQLSDFPGHMSGVHSSFLIGDKAYVLVDSIEKQFNPDLWEYDIESDQWTQKSVTRADLGIDPSSGYSQFIFAMAEYQSKGIVGVGQANFDATYDYNFKEYNPVNDEWENVATSYRGQYLDAPIVTSSFIYFVEAGSLESSSLVKFDMATKALSFEETPGIIFGNPGLLFSTSTGTLYFGLGNYPHTWGYSPVTKKWFAVSPAPFVRNGLYFTDRPVSFEINDKCYVVFGRDVNGPTKKVIEFTP